MMLFMFLFPLLAGFSAAVIQPWSDFWWDFTVYFFYVWLAWVLLSALIGCHNHRFARLFPFILTMNIGALLALVPMWRLSNEDLGLGVLLLSSHFVKSSFAYIYSKEWLKRDFSKKTMKFWFGLIILLPILWLVYAIFQGVTVGGIFKAYGGALCYYFLDIYIVTLSIRYREPDWTTEDKHSV
jgi:hypothetical protein